MSKLETITIDTPSGSSALQIGDGNTATIGLGKSGDTINIPAGATIANAGTATGFGEANTPCFYAYMSSAQSVSDNTNTKVAFNTVHFQTSGVYDTTNYKFTPGVAGYYQFNIGAMGDADANSALESMNLYLFKNGTGTAYKGEIAINYQGNPVRTGYCYLSIPLIADADDYFEVYMQVNDDGGGARYINRTGSFFSAFKITTSL